jgi:hypothetical protein
MGCHLFGGKFFGYSSAPIELGYWSDPTIASYGYTHAVTHAISQWTSQAYIPSLNSTSESSAKIKFYMGTLDPEVGGKVFFYEPGTNNDISNQVEFSDIGYNHAIVVIHHAFLSSLPQYGPDLREAIVTHETGHTLGVSHLSNSPPHTGDHVMNSGSLLKTLTTTDVQHAQYKFLNDY